MAVLPFSSERKKSAVSFADGTTLILGAPTFVLDDAHLAPIRKTLSDCARRGLRVLVLAEADGCVTETDTPAIARVIGLCLLTDEIRPAAQETLHYFHTQGVALKIISGDDEKTVAAIARKVGLSGGAVDAEKFDLCESVRHQRRRTRHDDHVDPDDEHGAQKRLDVIAFEEHD